jgi:hypothetical protein
MTFCLCSSSFFLPNSENESCKKRCENKDESCFSWPATPLSTLLEYSSGVLRAQANDGGLQWGEATDEVEPSRILGPDGQRLGEAALS